MTNKGQGKLFAIISIAFVAAVVAAVVYLPGNESGLHKSQAKRHTEQKQIVQMKPLCDQDDNCKGVYAYRDTSGDWLYYYFLFHNSGSSSSPYSGFGSSLPPGGSWTRSANAPDEAAELQQQEVAVQADSNGNIATDETTTTTNEPSEVTAPSSSSDETTASTGNSEETSAATESVSTGSDSGGSDFSSSSSDSGSSGGGDSGGGGSD